MSTPAIAQLSPRATRILANNPGPMTLEGTNTYVLREPGSRGVVVLDPGPLDHAHLDAVLAEAWRDGGEVQLVLYSHGHADHTESIDRFAELTGAAARAGSTTWCRNAAPLADAELLHLAGLNIRVLATPGHTKDSICLLLSDEGSLLTGDTILGRGTSVIAHPDGALGPYLNSLHQLRALMVDGANAGAVGRVERILPGHGPVITRPLDTVDSYLAQRQQRLHQIAAAMDAGDHTPRQIVERLYAEVDSSLWGAAELSVRAALDYLTNS